MDKSQVIFSIGLVTLLLMVLMAFLLFMLFWQRNKSNKYIRERETMKSLFNEQLLRAQLEIQEQSFNTISMEIHDNVGQTLSLLNVQLNIIDQKDGLDKLMLADAKESVKKAMTDLRDIAKSLSTERVQLLSLTEITAHELQWINQTGLLRTSFHHEGEEKVIPDEKKLILFRMIQECFQNVIKHSGATNAAVCFFYTANYLEINIKDDGKGFDMDLVLANEKKGLGLQNMIKRAKLINGEAKIHSSISGGTTITIIIPYA